MSALAVAGLLLAAPSVAAPVAGSGDGVQKASERLEAGQPRAAMIQLKNRLREDPGDMAARSLLGRVYNRMGKPEAAAVELERARDAGAARADWQYPLARAYLQQGRPEEAWATAAPRRGDAPAFRARLLVLRGLARLRQDRPDEAAAAFARALELDGDNPDALRGRALLALRQGRPEQAASLLERARGAAPDDARNWILTGQLHERQGEGQGAIAAYRRARALDPANREAAVGLARALLRAGQVDQAAEMLASLPDSGRTPMGRYLEAVVAVERGRLERARDMLETLTARSDFAPARFLLGWVAFRQGRFETAADVFERSLDSAADRVVVGQLLAAAYLHLGSPGKAVETLERLRDEAGGDPRFRVLLGRAEIAAGDAAAGMQDLRAAAAAAPEDAAVQSQVAVGFLAGGRGDRAVAPLEKAVKLDSERLGGRALLVIVHLREGQYGEAEKVARDLAEDRPDSPLPANLLGLAHRGQGRTAEARADFRRALFLDDGFLPARVNLARLALGADRPDEAARYLGRVLKDHPDHLGALMLRVQVAARKGDAAGQAKWLERAWQAHPDSREAGVALLRLRLGQDQPLKALEVARVLEERHGDEPQVQALVAEAQLRTDHDASAVENLRALVQRQPESARAHFLLARAYRAQDSLGKARRELHHALELAPDHLPSLAALADLELAAGRPEAAMGAARRAQEADPGNAAGYLMAGRVHWKAGELAAAAGAYREALARGPSRPAVRRLVQIHRRQGRPERALTMLREWLQGHPDDHGMRVRLAGLLQAQGELAGAAAAYERVRRDHPKRADLWNNLAWIYHQQGDERALRYARKAHELAPERAAITDTYGWILVQRGDAGHGLRLLQEAAIHAPHVPTIRYHLGIALWRTGRTGAARTELRQVLQADDSFAEADQAREVLRQLGAASGV